jgi:7-keto-8-aminopelargonate synthetase-like enzyme
MTTLDQDLAVRLTRLREDGLYRELRRIDSPQSTHVEVAGRRLLNFSSNDYLGLANHPAVTEAARQAVERFGAGSGAARLVCGSLAPHHDLEEALAAFKGTEAALTFSSGYTTALGVIPALTGKQDIVVIDKRVHACLVDAARLAGARLRVFAHNDCDDLERILKWAAAQRSPGAAPSTTPAAAPSDAQRSRVLIVTESVFSMDGDVAPLRDIVTLKEQYGAWLIVDEAHATGLYGPHRRGLLEALELSDRVEIHLGTLGKALGAAGGYICGSRTLIDYLVNRARSFIFSTAPVPAAAAAAQAAIAVVQSGEGQRLADDLWARIARIREELARLGWPQPDPGSAILPILIGDERRAAQVAAALRDAGVFVPAIRFPTVARGAARLRDTLTAAHTTAEIAQFAQALAAAAGPPPAPLPHA